MKDSDYGPGLYVHIPWCRRRCGYCSFVSRSDGWWDADLHKAYVRAVLDEYRARRKRLPDDFQFHTLYVGGGTPSVLGRNLIRELLEGLVNNEWHPDEISFEANPEDLLCDPELPFFLDDLGVSRLSLGLQTFSPAGLKVLERQVTPEQNRVALANARKFPGSLSIDFILGWPGQVEADFERDDLPVLLQGVADHVSAYFLTAEPGTRTERQIRKNLLSLPDEDEQVGIHSLFENGLRKSGLKRYEISNAARPGHESRHNEATWKGHPYLGLGLGAVSRLYRTRFVNGFRLKDYLSKIQQGKFATASAEFLTEQTCREEDLFLSLRHRDGLNLREFERKHGCCPLPKGEKLERWRRQGWVRMSGDNFAFREKGWMLFDDLVSDMMLKIDE